MDKFQWRAEFHKLLALYRHSGMSEEDIVAMLVKQLNPKWFNKSFVKKSLGIKLYNPI